MASRNPLQRLLGRRPRPARRRAPAEVLPGSAAIHDRIRAVDFDEEKAHQAGVEYLAASFEVPRNTIMRVLHEPARFYLKAYAGEVDLTNDANTSEQIDLGADVSPAVDAVRSTRPAPTLPSSKHPDVTVYTNTGTGNAWELADVTAFDADAGTVTVAKPASTAVKARVYVLTGDGQVRFSVLAPAGSGARERQIYNNTLAGMHESDQADADAALVLPTMAGGPVDLSQQFRVGVYLTSTPEILWTADQDPRHEVSIPILRRAVRVHDASALVAQTLGRLGA